MLSILKGRMNPKRVAWSYNIAIGVFHMVGLGLGLIIASILGNTQHHIAYGIICAVIGIIVFFALYSEEASFKRRLIRYIIATMLISGGVSSTYEALHKALVTTIWTILLIAVAWYFVPKRHMIIVVPLFVVAISWVTGCWTSKAWMSIVLAALQLAVIGLRWVDAQEDDLTLSNALSAAERVYGLL